MLFGKWSESERQLCIIRSVSVLQSFPLHLISIPTSNDLRQNLINNDDVDASQHNYVSYLCICEKIDESCVVSLDKTNLETSDPQLLVREVQIYLYYFIVLHSNKIFKLIHEINVLFK